MSSWQLLMLICYAAVAAAPAPSPDEKHPTPSALAAPISPAEEKSLPSAFAVVIMSQPGWHCPDCPAHGSLQPPGRWLSSFSLFQPPSMSSCCPRASQWFRLFICTPEQIYSLQTPLLSVLTCPKIHYCLSHSGNVQLSLSRLLKISFAFPCNHPQVSV